MFTSLANFIAYHTPIFYLIQSVWRDEAFSFFMAKPDILQVIVNTAHDFNPPFYYLLLHFWMKIVGLSDESLRLLSFFAHLGSVYIAYVFAEKAMSRKFAGFVAAFTFLNPMLLYYAFEMRMYSFYALFTFASLYFLYSQKWKQYTVATVLGLYTHSFFPLILASYVVYLWLIKQLSRKNLFSVLFPIIFYLPWLPVIIVQFINSKNSWLFPVDLQLVTSVLGNLFTNYEGTPGNLWGLHVVLSIVILVFVFIAFKHKKKESLLFITPVILPLTAILGYSIVKQPLFVNRYMIFVTVFEIMAISLGVWSIKNKMLHKAAVIFWLLLITLINLSVPPYHKKTDFKSTFAQINKMAGQTDFVYTRTPIGFLESAYYFQGKGKTFVYNPLGIAVPNYIGVNVVFPDISRSAFPPPASRTFLVADDASYNLVINK